MLDKYVNINLDGFKASVRQAGGILQINDASVTGKCPQQVAERLDKLLEETFNVISKYNKQIASYNKDKEKKPPHPPKKEKNKNIELNAKM